MATAIAGLGAKGNTIIHDAEAVNKSYPDFYKDLKSVKVNSSINKKSSVV
jgi:3-phosphoshikimate 1-carboxyvinyltransferase